MIKLDRKFVRTQLTHLGIFILASLIMPYFMCPGCDSFYRYGMVGFFTFCIWFFLWKGNNLVAHLVSCRISWLEQPVRRFIVGTVTTIGYTIATVLALMYSFEYFFSFNFGDGFTWTLYFSVGFTIVIALFLHGREFFLFWRKAAIDAERLEKENITARFESLKNQVNPHFLFNSLNALTNLVYEDQEKAVTFIKQLSQVYRHVLDVQGKELVSLDEEMKFLESYLFLQRIRFGDKLLIEVNLQGATGLVAPLVLQMLAENAIKHNEVSTDHPLTLKIFYRDGNVVVENNLRKKMMLREESSGIGLDNIRNRYKHLSDRPVDVRESADKFVVSIPLIVPTDSPNS